MSIENHDGTLALTFDTAQWSTLMWAAQLRLTHLEEQVAAGEYGPSAGEMTPGENLYFVTLEIDALASTVEGMQNALRAYKAL